MIVCFFASEKKVTADSLLPLFFGLFIYILIWKGKKKEIKDPPHSLALALFYAPLSSLAERER